MVSLGQLIMTPQPISARSPQQIKEKCRQDEKIVVILSKGQQGALIGTLQKHLGGKDNRQLVCGWLFLGMTFPLSSKKLTPGQWNALWQWVDFQDIDDEKWKPQPAFQLEAGLVLTEVIRSKKSVEGVVDVAVKEYDAIITRIIEMPELEMEVRKKSKRIHYEF